MTGIRARRMWPDGTLPSDASAAAGRAVLGVSGLRREQIGLFVHAAVSRDMLEPASASFAHRKIGLPASTQVFDVSNACLGFLNAVVVAAAMIDSGQIESALIAAGENGRPIGCGAVAAVLCRRDLAAGRGHRLLEGVCRAATEHSELCQGNTAGAGALAMQTDSERMLAAGVALAHETWADFQRATGWTAASLQRVICHQVGSAHRRRLFETLGLDLAKDYSTFETLGNMGSVSLPATLAAAAEAGAVRRGDQVALMGIGSGLNCLMLALEW
jgi:3-oxoacyl-[acyl-carrier-protein] synthase-3